MATATSLGAIHSPVWRGYSPSRISNSASFAAHEARHQAGPWRHRRRPCSCLRSNMRPIASPAAWRSTRTRLESIVNVATAVAAFFAVRLSAVPPDANHPYGHHKVEYLSAVVEGVLIVRRRARHPAQGLSRLSRPAADRRARRSGSRSTAVATVDQCRLVLPAVSLSGGSFRSPALLADAHHLLTDVITSLGVLGRRHLAGRSPAGCVLDSIIAGARRAAYPLVGLGADAAVDRRADGRGGVQRHAGEDPPGDLEGSGRRARGARSAHAACRAHDLHRVPPRGAGHDERRQLARHLRPHRSGAQGRCARGAVVTIHVEPEDKAKLHGGVPVV